MKIWRGRSGYKKPSEAFTLVVYTRYKEEATKSTGLTCGYSLTLSEHHFRSCESRFHFNVELYPQPSVEQ